MQSHSDSSQGRSVLQVIILLGRLWFAAIKRHQSSIMRRLSPRGFGWPLFALNLVHSSGIQIGNALIEVKTTSAFPVGHGHHLYEISVEPINSIHHLCSDGSTPSWLWSTGEERSSLYRTFLRGCKKNASLLGGPGPRPRPSSLRATVCHPFVKPFKNAVHYPKLTYSRWVNYYLDRGFQHVYFYVHSAEYAYADIPSTTWFVVPWIQAKGLHYGGQLTAINHCLYWNKVQRTGWTFFGDVDEFMAVGAPAVVKQ